MRSERGQAKTSFTEGAKHDLNMCAVKHDLGMCAVKHAATVPVVLPCQSQMR